MVSYAACILTAKLLTATLQTRNKGAGKNVNAMKETRPLEVKTIKRQDVNTAPSRL